MRLYFSPGACSLAPHIVLRELGIDFELSQVNLKECRTKDGGDFRKVNPKGAVPALILDDGQLLTEVAAILQYLGDRKPELGLVPPPTAFERYRLQEWLNHLATDFHKQLSPMFGTLMSDAHREATREKLAKAFGAIDAHLAGGSAYLMGERFSVADAYLFVMTTWMVVAKLDLAKWPNLAAWAARMKARPAVDEARKVEREAKTRV